MDPIQTQNFQNNTPAVFQDTSTTSSSDNGAGFAAALGVAANLAGRALGASSGGALGGGALNGLLNGNGATSGVQDSIARNQSQTLELLQIQSDLQFQNQQFTLLSNTSRQEHETRMAAVRNIRG